MEISIPDVVLAPRVAMNMLVAFVPFHPIVAAGAAMPYALGFTAVAGSIVIVAAVGAAGPITAWLPEAAAKSVH
jgi:hypothetical protein